MINKDIENYENRPYVKRVSLKREKASRIYSFTGFKILEYRMYMDKDAYKGFRVKDKEGGSNVKIKGYLWRKKEKKEGWYNKTKR